MNETEKKLNIMLEGLIELAGQTTALASDQVPLVLQEIITWCLIRNYLILFIFTIILLVVCFFLYRLLKRWSTRLDEDIIDLCDNNIVFLATFTICFGTLWLIMIHETLKVTFAPKLYLLEYLKGLL